MLLPTDLPDHHGHTGLLSTQVICTIPKSCRLGKIECELSRLYPAFMTKRERLSSLKLFMGSTILRVPESGHWLSEAHTLDALEDSLL